MRNENVPQETTRLYPPLSSRVYWPLTMMRRELEGFISANQERLKDARVLDFGCGEMPYRHLFRKAGVSEYLGADLPAQAGADILIGPDGAIQGYEGYFDVVISLQVLEHVSDPAAYLAECRRLLKPGGLLLLSTHGLWQYHPHPHDYWRWTSEGLKKIVWDAGFSQLSFRGVLGLSAIASQLWQDALRKKIPGFLRPLFFLVMQQIVALQDKLTSQEAKDRDAGSYVLTALKKDA